MLVEVKLKFGVVRSKRLIQSPSFLAVLLSFFVAGCLQNIFNVSLTW